MKNASYTDIVSTGNLLSRSLLKSSFKKSKKTTIKVATNENIIITCKLTGTYYYNKSTKRCYFGKINKPTFSVYGGSWKNRGFTYSLIDSSRTAMINIKGKAVVGNNYSKNFSTYMEFHCADNGVI
ncbi:MAG: hypothetical protein PHD56_10150 [Anaerostipes sp.]|nr:hypothetical protein [Anaerostipes sp.]